MLSVKHGQLNTQNKDKSSDLSFFLQAYAINLSFLLLNRNIMKFKLHNQDVGGIIKATKQRGVLMANKNVHLRINQSWCKGCGICVAFCPKDVLSIVEEKVSITDEELCIRCGLCEQRCPDYAIYLEEN